MKVIQSYKNYEILQAKPNKTTLRVNMNILHSSVCVPAGVIQFRFWFGTERSVQILILIHTEIWSTRVWSDNSLLHGWDLM